MSTSYNLRGMIAILFLFYFGTASSQTSSLDSLSTSIKSSRSVSIGIGGNALGLGLFYNQNFEINRSSYMSYSVGMGFIKEVVTMAGTLSYNIKMNKFFLELGVGGTMAFGQDSALDNSQMEMVYFLSPIIGIKRYFKSGLYIRFYVSPIFNITPVKYNPFYNPMDHPGSGFSLGYYF